MKVCVTGATGFVGAHVAAARAGRARGPGDRPGPAAPASASTASTSSRRRRRPRPRLPRRALRGCDMLFHAAGMVASRPRARGLAGERGRAADRRGGGRGGGRAARGRHLQRRRDRPRARADAPRTSANPTPRPARARSTRMPSTRASWRPSPPARGSGSTSWSYPVLCAGPGVQPLAAGRDVHPDRRELPARPAAGDRGLVHEHRGRRGRRARAICWPRGAACRASATSSAATTCAGPEVIERVARLSGHPSPAGRAAAASSALPAPERCGGCPCRPAARGHAPDGARLALLVGKARRELGYQPRAARPRRSSARSTGTSS